MIKFENIVKQYGDKKALDHVSFTINEGEIFGLIGHNGAGKSTAIKILVSIIEATAGQVSVNDLLLNEHRDEIKKHIGYVSDSPDIFLRLQAEEYWELIKGAFDIPDDQYQERLEHLVHLFSLENERQEFIENFSHGMRQKTFLIGALLPNPDIWILDEPMTGLDPQAQYDLKEMMRQHAAEGNIVLFSTHALEVAQELCDRLVILRRGKVIYEGTLDQLQAQNPGRSLEAIYLDMAGRKADERDAQHEQASEMAKIEGVDNGVAPEESEPVEEDKEVPEEIEEEQSSGTVSTEMAKAHLDELKHASSDAPVKERDDHEF